MALVASGTNKVYHLPSIPIGILESHLAITKNAPDQPALASQKTVEQTWPESLFPLRGCRILTRLETNTAYSMPIRPLPVIGDVGIKNRLSAQAWCDFALNNGSLSYRDKVACLQRAVILDQRNPGLWYTLLISA
jgi:hypothetical protein